MARHPDSPAFIQYLLHTISGFSIELEARLRAARWPPGKECYNILEVLHRDFFMHLTLPLANAKNGLSDSEIAFWSDIETAVFSSVSEFPADIRMLQVTVRKKFSKQLLSQLLSQQ